MQRARFQFLGSSEESAGDLELEGEPLETGTVIPALWRRSPPWNPGMGFERVIIGSHSERADILLEGEGIEPEHVRMYLPREGGSIDFRPLQGETTRVEGRPIDRLEIVRLEGGEEIEIGPWRFRFELEA